jgi:hypothetical protein
LVIAVTAIAALVQLRHRRKGTWLAAQLKILEIWHSEVIQGAYNYIKIELPRRLEDPAYRAELEYGPLDRSVHLEMTMVDRNTQLGLLLEQGLIDDGFIALYSPAIRTSWKQLAPVFAILRRNHAQSTRHFDYLVARSTQISERPWADVFRGLERPAIDDPWLAIDHPERPLAG